MRAEKIGIDICITRQGNRSLKNTFLHPSAEPGDIATGEAAHFTELGRVLPLYTDMADLQDRINPALLMNRVGRCIRPLALE